MVVAAALLDLTNESTSKAATQTARFMALRTGSLEMAVLRCSIPMVTPELARIAEAFVKVN